MSRLWDNYIKAGGVRLIKQYWRTGVLLDVISLFFLLGRGKTSLLMLREIVALKIQKKLKKRYSYVFKSIDKEYTDSQSHDTSKTIWIFWWQGMEEAPLVVKKCYQSVLSHLRDWNVVLITQENYRDYSSFPD